MEIPSTRERRARNQDKENTSKPNSVCKVALGLGGTQSWHVTISKPLILIITPSLFCSFNRFAQRACSAISEPGPLPASFGYSVIDGLSKEVHFTQSLCVPFFEHARHFYYSIDNNFTVLYIQRPKSLLHSKLYDPTTSLSFLCNVAATFPVSK